MTTDPRVATLVQTMGRLTELFQEENDAIRRRDIPALTTVADRKPLVVRTYEDCVRSFRAEAESLRMLSDECKRTLKEASDRFVDATLEHARLVRAATQVTQSTVNTLVNTINKARADDGMYTRRGGAVMPAAYTRKGAPSMAYNRSF